MLLDVRDLSVSYGSAQALDRVALSVGDGEVVALIGANGAGKTSLLRTISGLKRAATGEISFLGERIEGVSAHRIVRMGVAHVPEGRMVFGPMTVLDTCAWARTFVATGPPSRRTRSACSRSSRC